jgi:mannose-6-phosphate isomerase
VPVEDFALLAVTSAPEGAEVPLAGPAIAVATAGTPQVTGLASGGVAALTSGAAVLVTPDEGGLRVTGKGELFIALPGH